MTITVYKSYKKDFWREQGLYRDNEHSYTNSSCCCCFYKFLQTKRIKICKRCFLCHSIVFCKTYKHPNKCNKCPKGPDFKTFDKLGSGGRSESSSNPERGLHPPLSDPAQTGKVTNRHKLLCQSSQEPLPALPQLNNKNAVELVQNQKSLGFFNQLFLVPKPKMEADIRSKQSKPVPQGAKIQNGDTGNYQNLPPTRGVGYFSRFEGCLLSNTNTGTVQEISEISHPGQVISFQGTAIRSVHSSHGVHCYSKGGKADGHTQEYKDPPVPG